MKWTDVRADSYAQDGRERPCFACNEPIGAEAMVVMRPNDKVNESERVFHARCANRDAVSVSKLIDALDDCGASQKYEN